MNDQQAEEKSDPHRIQVLANGRISLNNQSVGSVDDLNELKHTLQKRFAETMRAESFGSPLRKVLVEAALSLSFADLLKLLNSVRDAGAKPLDIVIADGRNSFTVSIPVTADPDEDTSSLKPNPLALMVSSTANRRLFLNNDSQKSLEVLLKRIKTIFLERKKMRAYRPGSNEVEATVFLEADSTLSLGEVEELLRTLRRAGANPLWLKIDDLERVRKLVSTAQPNKRLQRTRRYAASLVSCVGEPLKRNVGPLFLGA